MNPAIIDELVPLVAGSLGILATLTFAVLCFPSIRGGVAEWLSNRGMRNADALAVNEQLAALRGEVYALRTELATMSRTLSPHAVPALQPRPGDPPRIGP